MKRILHFGIAFLLLVPSLSHAAPVESRLAKLEKQLKEMNETAAFNNKRMAEALANFEQVREDMAKLRGEIEKIAHLSGADKKARRADVDELGHRLARMEERLADMSLTIKELGTMEAIGSKKTSAAKKAQNLFYQKAFSELTQRNYKTAAKQFASFVKKYPKSKLADNAQYWRGECFFALGDYETAILEFQTVVKRFPKGNKAPAAILKQGYAFTALKSYADAKAFLEKVIIEYPRSEEATRAREKITEVNKLIKKATK